MNEVAHHVALRYVQPLREGGSLPAVLDTDGGLFVTKFRGAGQGARALIAELLVAVLARELGLPVPEPAVIEVPSAFGQAEPDPEIQDILRGSHGVNVGLRYLDGAFNYDALAAGEYIGADLAAEVVWLDAFLVNPDRTQRNPNLMIWRRSPWLIDHGAALYVHHDWASVDEAKTRSPFPPIRDHVLLGLAGDIEFADARLAPRLTDEVLHAALAAVPAELLMDRVSRQPFGDAAAARARYVAYLSGRLAGRESFVAEAVRAQRTWSATPPRRRSARR